MNTKFPTIHEFNSFLKHISSSAIFILLSILPFLVSGDLQLNNSTLTKTIRSDKVNGRQVVKVLGNQPMRFEANIGQVADNETKFLSRGEGYSLLLKQKEAILDLQRGTGEEGNYNFEDSSEVTELRMRLVGGNPNPIVEAEEELVTKTNYFIGKDQSNWYTNIPNYARVKYYEVYQGIDLVYYGHEEQLEYDFVISPGARPEDIILELEGAEYLNIDDKGNLLITVGNGELELKTPIIYQEIDGVRKTVSGHYSLANSNLVCFNIDDYDSDFSLVIDPILSYSTFFGGSSRDDGRGIGADNAGNIYIMGVTYSLDLPLVNPIQNTKNGTSDLFVTKLDPSGSTILYSTYFGSNESDAANDFEVDVNGNAYLTGFTMNNDFPIYNAFIGSMRSNLMAFVTKFNSSGSLVYSTFLGGSDGEYGFGITADAAGNAYTTGVTASLDFPIVNAYQSVIDTTKSRADLYVTKFSPTGSIVYSTFLGGNRKEWESAIAVDDSGNAFVVGRTWSEDFPVVNAFQATYAGESDLFVTKFNADGSGLVYSTYIGGSDQEFGYLSETFSNFDIAVDSEGNAYVTGGSSSVDFPLVNAFQEEKVNFGEPFVLKLSADGSKLIYSTRLGGSLGELSLGIAVDSEGSAYVVGGTYSNDFPTENAIFNNYMGGPTNIQGYLPLDIFITKFTPDGSNLLFSTYFGGSGYDLAKDIFIDNRDNAYVTGVTSSSEFLLVNPLQSNLNSDSWNAFIIKFEEGKLPETEGKIWQVVKFAGEFNTNKEQNKVEFIRVVDGNSIRVEAEIIEVTADTISVRVPEGLIGEFDNSTNTLTRKDVQKQLDVSNGSEVILVEIAVTWPNQLPITSEYWFRLIFPQHLIYDEVVIGGPPIFSPRLPPFTQQILPQAMLNFEEDVQIFTFIGKSTDGTAGLRVMNTNPFPVPLRLQATIIGADGAIINTDPPMNIGSGNEGFQFPVSKDGLYMIVVSHRDGLIFKPGPFQIHLSGNVGIPRIIDNGVKEDPRATRLDILFNHPAPRPQTLVGQESTTAQTALFKFANPVTVNPYSIAVLVPPIPLGFRSGIDAIVRAPDPDTLGLLSTNGAIDITTPTARSRTGRTFDVEPWLGTILDFTQIPDPASVEEEATYLGRTLCAIVGEKDFVTLSLPEIGVNSLIVDMGSGQEIVDGSGNDFKVYSSSGNYAIAVANTPFTTDFRAITGVAEGDEEFDLSISNLSSARYVRITASPDVTLDAVQALNYFTDAIKNNFPVASLDKTTITMRRAKAPETLFDPWLELIAPNGSLIDRSRTGFGDLTSVLYSDAALINRTLIQFGYYRFLGRGYNLTPDSHAFGSFLVRLESGGIYDPVDIIVSDQDESLISAQKQGVINEPRQRDSYIFQAIPGQPIKITVNGTGDTPLLNPVLELYDPEDYLIAANDDYPGRGRNAVLNIHQLPATSYLSGAELSTLNPSAYRIVVSAIDGLGEKTQFDDGSAYKRTVVGGDYELKVFEGAIIGGNLNPQVNSISPNSAFRGTTDLEVTINGARFAEGAFVSFSGSGITVTNITYVNSEQLNITIDIAVFTDPGQYNITATNPDGQSGSGVGLFEVISSLGTVELNWIAPTIGQTLNPPTGLTAQLGGNQILAKYNEIPAAADDKFNSLSSKRSKYIQRLDTNTKLSKSKQPLKRLQKKQQAVELSNGIPISGTVGYDEVNEYFISVPENATNISFETNNSTGDPDLFVRFELPPDAYNYIYDFISENIAPNEELIIVSQNTMPPVQAGKWYVTIYGFEQSNYTLTATHDGTGGLQPHSYNLYRSTLPDASNSGLLIKNLEADTTNFIDNVPNLGTFYYQVTAVYDQGESEPSNEASVLVTGVGEGESTSQPAEFALEQNYPNPFNPSTKIIYSIQNQNYVTLRVYDILGGEVITLVNKEQSEGTYKLEFDGSELPSGIYFYRLQVYTPGRAGDYVETKKMILLK